MLRNLLPVLRPAHHLTACYRACTLKHLHISTPSRHAKMYRLFEDSKHAENYASFRPVYPQQVSDAIAGYCRKTLGDSLDLALDLACGSGQGTWQLCRHFSRVTGVDISREQILRAQKTLGASHPGLTFLVGPGEELGFQGDDSVDLVTVAQSMHWFDAEKFYREVKRVLRPGGALAIYGYGNVTLDNEEASAVVRQHYADVRTYFEDGRKHIDDHYAAFSPLPFDDFERRDDMCIKNKTSLPNFIGYLRSWSAYEKYMKLHPTSKALEEVEERLLETYNLASGANQKANEVQVVAKWPLFILLGRKPCAK